MPSSGWGKILFSALNLLFGRSGAVLQKNKSQVAAMLRLAVDSLLPDSLGMDGG